MRRQRPDIQERLGALARQYDLVAIYALGSHAIKIAARVSGEEVEAMHPKTLLLGYFWFMHIKCSLADVL